MKNWVKDLFFPKFCVTCENVEGEWLCETCLAKIAAPKMFYCLQPAAGGVSYLDNAAAFFSYEENTVAKLIKLFKYNYLTDLAEIFAKIIKKEDFNFNWRGFTVVPVPLHPRRERERGFNQAEITARIFAEKLGLEINTGLRRGVYTTQQAKLTKEERQKNLKNAFVWDADNKRVPSRNSGTPLIAGEKVLLVDDVFTTGATMQECAKVLKNNGVKVVWGLALASG